MPELDYAMLAEYATVTGGKLTMVGASYTHLQVSGGLGRPHLLSVAGRIRAPEGTPSVVLKFEVESPNKEFTVGGEVELTVGPETRPYNGKIGILFAFSVLVPIPSEGLYTINLWLDGERVRRLAFDAEAVAP